MVTVRTGDVAVSSARRRHCGFALRQVAMVVARERESPRASTAAVDGDCVEPKRRVESTRLGLFDRSTERLGGSSPLRYA
jgi:hypothetical protein